MSGKPSIHVMTREEATALLPFVRAELAELRSIRDRVPRLQAQVEIEEMTGRSEEGTLRADARARVKGILAELKGLTADFKKRLVAFTEKGVHLKDLDRGLVDFYGQVAGETVFLCWLEGEDEVSWYHPLEGGFSQRKPL